MTYISGGAYALCDVCGFKHRLRDLKKRWDGMMVCSKDYDPAPPQMRSPNVKPEGLPLPNARPDNQGGNEPNTTTPGDL